MLSHIKLFVENSVRRREREALPGASDAWQLGTSLSAYLRQLDEHELRHLRRHTFHFTGDNYQRYLFGNVADRDLIVEQMNAVFARLPGFILDEGEYGIGYETELGRISFDLIRYLSVLADLVDSGALNRADRKPLLEIGGGYGGLARTILAFAPSCSYVICDLEEMLFCSAVYLTNMHGPERIHLVENGIDAVALEPGHFYLVPQINLERLHGKFSLVINQQSMQEMEQGQVERYCDFMKENASQFYSRNLSSLDSLTPFLSHFKLVRTLNEYFKQRFPVIWVGSEQTAGVGDANLERLLLRCGP